MRTVAAVQHDGMPAVGVEGDGCGKVAHLELPSGRAERPLVGEDDGAVRLRAGGSRGGFGGPQARA